jgi:hypothetical protein
MPLETLVFRANQLGKKCLSPGAAAVALPHGKAQEKGCLSSRALAQNSWKIPHVPASIT